MTVDYTKIGEQMSSTAHKPHVKSHAPEQKVTKKEPVYGEQPRKQEYAKPVELKALSFDPKTIPFGKKFLYGIIIVICVAYPILFIPVAYFAFKSIKKYTQEAKERHHDTVTGNIEPKNKLEIKTGNPQLQNVLDKLSEHMPEEALNNINQQIKASRSDKKH